MLRVALVISAILFPAKFGVSGPLDPFRGDYLSRGEGVVRQTGREVGRGPAQLRVVADAGGEKGALIVQGSLRLGGVERRFRQRIGLQLRGRGVNRNLAPGYDDGYAARGRYRVLGNRVLAQFPFVIRTTQGTATVEIRLAQRDGRRRLVVTQTLSSNTLPAPLVWRFVASAGRSE